MHKVAICRPYWKYFSMDGVFYEEMLEAHRDLPDAGVFRAGGLPDPGPAEAAQ